ncbi:MAG: SusC/RagA family TonB-linked outer membrane protein [Gemmatimonadaceae bacterium]|nr:SusC/RagA family TonB-linked outer membrane protein [Chitinophagaceae bacterium]
MLMKYVLLVVLLCRGLLLPAQDRSVSGVVQDEKEVAVPFATITETGTKNAVQANEQGQFAIKITGKSGLTISAAGYESRVITSLNNPLKITMVRADGKLEEVVVSTLGGRRTRNQLAYAAQQINGDEVSKNRNSNFIQNLSGKVAGLDIKQGNSMGASTNVVIRGVKSITGNNQALFVIDGVPYNNGAGTTTSQNNSQRTGGGGYDYGNAAADINPDDIASVTVLKGAAASALFGSQGSNGVILITTKRGAKGIGITINSGVSVGRIDKSTFPKYQREYGAGYFPTTRYEDPSQLFLFRDVNGDGTNDLVAPIHEDASYGARFDPNLMVYQYDAFDPLSPNYRKPRAWVAGANDPSKFFETAFSSNQSILIDGASDKGTFKLGYTRNDDKGILPNSKIKKNLLNFGATYNITDKLTAGASLNFSNIDGKGRYGTGYDGAGARNLMTSFRQWWQVNVDIKDQKEVFNRTGLNRSWNIKAGDPYALTPNFWDNPYWVVYKNYETDTRNRYFGNTNLNYVVADWLTITGRIALDSYNEIIEERRAVGSTNTASYSRFNRSYRETNIDLLATINKDLTTELALKGLLGTNIRKQNTSYIRARTNGGLIVPEVYALSNSLNAPLTPEEFEGKREVQGVFGGATLIWRNMITLDATMRRDVSSTLPKGNNVYYYPSVSGGFTFSELLPSLTWLSYGKLRANYAQVGADAPLYTVRDVYGVVNPFGSNPQSAVTGLNNNYTKNNPDLKPELTRSMEAGIELAFLKNRIGLDVTYYKTKTINQILPVEVSTATGYDAKYLNAGSMENKGIEVSLNGSPVRSKDFTWNVTVNWSKNDNRVVELFEGAENLLLGNFQVGTINATVGQPYGTIRGSDYIYTKGQKTVSATGRYLRTSNANIVIGNVNPDWMGGINNSFKYKNLSLSFLIDVKHGGDVLSLDMYYGLSQGMYPETAGLNDLGKPSRAPLAEGGGIILPGVDATGKANTIRVVNGYGTYGDYRNPAKGFVYDASYVKLREVVMNYSLPSTFVSKLKAFKGIDLSLVGRNLWIIHKNLPYSDPEDSLGAGNIQGYQAGAYPTVRTLTFNVKLKF